MKTIQKNSQIPTLEIVLKGWKSLVKKLGAEGATKFLHSFYLGKGNSIKEYKKM